MLHMNGQLSGSPVRTTFSGANPHSRFVVPNCVEHRIGCPFGFVAAALSTKRNLCRLVECKCENEDDILCRYTNSYIKYLKINYPNLLLYNLI